MYGMPAEFNQREWMEVIHRISRTKRKHSIMAMDRERDYDQIQYPFMTKKKKKKKK